MNELVLATSNAGKIKELEALLAPIHCIPQASLGIQDAVENGLSFVENAIIKARYASAQANKPALADDSGLVVPALNGEPGIYSARYAGEHANDKKNIHALLEKMSSLSDQQREAYFYCAIVLVKQASDPAPLITTGIFKGTITHQEVGDEGFGYDPIFYIPERQCTAAELPIVLKNKISHRAQALAQLRQILQDHDE